MIRTIALLLSLFMAGLPLIAAEHPSGIAPFATARDIDLLMLLPPPPAADSATTRAELATLLALQDNRTQEQVDLALADEKQEVWRFASVIAHADFIQDRLPLCTAFFARVIATEPAVVDPAKTAWARPRPHMTDPRIKPIGRLKTSGSYPSGHATVGTLMGIILADMVPEKRGAIMARAGEFGHNRVMSGIHYPEDVVAGRLAGTAIAAVLMHQQDFIEASTAAKAELRRVIGLP